ncbi:MAG: TIGR03915 family putative DNA repair protein [Clostridiales bacterium]|nr:TIGR03915 family putative DNA repair protein [Clostridiales bacterium]
MNNRHIFFCEDSLEGIFTGVYTAWDLRVGHGNVELKTRDSGEMEFFCQYHTVETDLEKAEKVLNTLRKKLGEEITRVICYAACSYETEKGTAIYRTLVDCLSVHGASYGKKKLENLKNPYVRKVMEAYRNVWNEYHHFLGFLRFRQLPGNILFAPMEPKNDVLLLFQEHFGDRFSGEYWIIYDEKRKKALLHAPHEKCTIYSGAGQQMERLLKLQDTEADFETLFQGFCRHISIHERENPALQRKNLPLRFRNHMVEFNKN